MQRRPLLAFAGLCAIAPTTRAATAAPWIFELDAPDARAVFLAGDMTAWDAGKRALQREADGRWRLRIALEPGQWVYKFVVDGRWIADPANPQRDSDGLGGQHSFIWVGDGDWQVPAGAPRGRVETLRLPSRAWRGERLVHVYLPPGLAQPPTQPTPLLLLLHGAGMDADQWLRTGQVDRFMDSLLARGRLARPFGIVMPSSDAVPYDGRSERHLMQELLPQVQKRYGFAQSREKVAVAGMSMGGRGAVALAHRHPRHFGLAYGLAGWYPPELLAALPLRPVPPIELDLVCGTGDELITGNRALAARLKAAGRTFVYDEIPGAHDWHTFSGQSARLLMRVGEFFARGGR
ncbi:alpha/beta hydrolase [Aquabacterium humicola]|uniref:alpha/beta hydrolase n=1 Tax=Aquabacterium humicola TaxID=3237377 RepID=UPI0025430518|nr:alpha/beta hydrolase-fold protein [Rubrivivax pictus]